jgi:putative membrane protein insertion efficiency factor
MRRSWKVVAWSFFGLCLYLTAEAFLAPSVQPTARLGVGILHLYQATGSRAAESAGVRCRYTPTCSHYAEDAISHYGTLGGVARTAGRLWRCSPWGGSGYDPAVEPHSAAYLDPQQDNDTEVRRRRQEEEAKKAVAAACLSGGVGCAIMIGIGAVLLAIKIFMIIWTFKDSKARGDQNAVLWIVLLLFTNIVGFVIYLCVRPKGDLIPCPNCHQNMLETLTKCPHCSADSGAAAAPPAK